MPDFIRNADGMAICGQDDAAGIFAGFDFATGEALYECEECGEVGWAE
jgi:hypothetical protein